MNYKKTASIGIIVISFIISVWISLENTSPENTEVKYKDYLEIEPDVIMPTKVSRPGCEQSDSCYIPSSIIVTKGEKVVWQNQDSAFHSVTSGKYDTPTELFDSGHLDPYQVFVFTFEKSGIYDYFCTLHPWMEGQVIVN